MRSEETSDLPLSEELRLGSDRICQLILYTDLPWVDIEIEINRLREVCLEKAPEKTELFEGVYVSRFERLREQWRSPEGFSIT